MADTLPTPVVVTPGNQTSEWAAFKIFSLVVPLIATIGGALIEKGLITNTTTVGLILGAIVTVAAALAKYTNDRSSVKIAALQATGLITAAQVAPSSLALAAAPAAANPSQPST